MKNNSRFAINSFSFLILTVLLNPGSYLRIAENSEFEFTDTSLDSLRVKIIRGTALVEVTGSDEARTSIEIMTRQSRITIERRGLYRINVPSTNATELLVRKGQALIRSEATLATTGSFHYIVARIPPMATTIDTGSGFRSLVTSAAGLALAAGTGRSVSHGTVLAV